jgi:hypothetical protein
MSSSAGVVVAVARPYRVSCRLVGGLMFSLFMLGWAVDCRRARGDVRFLCAGDHRRLADLSGRSILREAGTGNSMSGIAKIILRIPN